MTRSFPGHTPGEVLRREQEARTTELKQRLVENNIYAGAFVPKIPLGVSSRGVFLSDGTLRSVW